MPPKKKQTVREAYRIEELSDIESNSLSYTPRIPKVVKRQ